MAKLPKDVAVRVHSVHKDFHLPHYSDDSIKRRIIHTFKPKDKSVDIHHALRGISFDIKKGEFFGIVGRNGSGKSTLLKIISKIYTPTSGRADHRGKLVAFIELGVGFNPELTGRENVYLNGAMLGFSRSEINAMYDEIVAFAELEEFMDLQLKNYSSGMKVRLAFSVAIRAQADILVLDEVLAVGDAAFQRKCYDYFKNLKEAHKTIILVSHSMSLIKNYCDRAILIEDGQIASDGGADKVANEYLKLFNKNDKPKQSNKSARIGDQSVVIKNLDIKISIDLVKVTALVEAKGQPKHGVKFGFRIKDSKGKLLAGANNLNVKDGQPMDFVAHETKELTFTMPNIFGDQEYSLSASINLGDVASTCDVWEDAATFRNSREQVFYPIVCPAELEIKSKN